MGGENAKATPMNVATPLPPLNFNQIGKRCQPKIVIVRVVPTQKSDAFDHQRSRVRRFAAAFGERVSRRFRICCIGKDDDFALMLADRRAKLRWIGFIMLRFLVGDDELFDVRLAVKASEPLDVRVDDVEAVAGMLSFQRIVNDAVLVGAADAQSVRLIVDEMIPTSETAAIFLQRAAAVETQAERDQRHAERNAVGRLAEKAGSPS